MNRETAKQYENVAPELKDLWSVELDLLQEFAAVCEKHDLRWFVDGGTLLGTVRHHGFIPWDDDIDIIMPYDDYCKLCNLENEFESPYFFQSWKTEDGWRPYMCRLRRSDTTGYTHREKSYPKTWNKGIFIDVFAMSNIPDNKLVSGTQLLLLKMMRAVYFGYEATRDGVPASEKKYIDVILKGCYRFFQFFSGKNGMKRLANSYVKVGGWQKKKSSLCGPILFRPYFKGLIWSSDWYNSACMLDFMDLTVPCPEDYDSRLKCQYGDYMTPVKAPSYHGGLFYDSHHSYTHKEHDAK